MANGKGKREKTNAPSIFIAKTYEILEVALPSFRTTTQISLSGIRKAHTLLSLMLTALNKKYCLFTSDTEISHRLWGNSTCTISTKYVTNKTRVFLNTVSLEEAPSIFSYIKTTFKEYQKKGMSQQESFRSYLWDELVTRNAFWKLWGYLWKKWNSETYRSSYLKGISSSHLKTNVRSYKKSTSLRFHC